MTVKARIDATTGLVELEGDKEFVSTYLDKILPMLQTLRNAQRSPKANIRKPDSEDGDGSKPADSKKTRRGKARPPQGTSCRSRILTLKEDKFFKEQRTPSEIATGLGKKGWTHNANQVSAALVTMFKNHEIQRTKGAKGWSYYWDRG